MPDPGPFEPAPGGAFHPGLRRQLLQAGLPEDPARMPEGPWLALLRQVDASYREAEAQTAGEGSPSGARERGEFFAGLSHEVRTPMNGVLGMIQLLLATDLSRHQRQMAQVALESSQTLLAVLTDVLDLARPDSGVRPPRAESFSPAVVFREAVGLLRPCQPARAEQVEIRLGPGLPEVALGDPQRLRRVLLGAFASALDSAAGAPVELALSAGRDAAFGEFLLCEAKYPGRGGPEAAGLFLPFKGPEAEPDGKPSGGTGPGLFITRESVERMGGRMGHDSLPDNRSRLWITLPLRTPGGNPDARAAAGIPEASASRAHDPAAGFRILLVEDNLVNQRVFESMLEHLGYACEKAANGREALAAMSAKRYDLVFMDCQMPVLDGYEAVRLARAASPPHTGTIIAMTAHALEGDREKCLRAGMDDYLAKPVSLESLRGMLEKWLGARRDGREG